MTNGDDPKNKSERSTAARNGLRLIKNEPEVPAEEKPRPGLKNPLVKFMSAYADAIDRDIQAILDL